MHEMEVVGRLANMAFSQDLRLVTYIGLFTSLKLASSAGIVWGSLDFMEGAGWAHVFVYALAARCAHGIVEQLRMGQGGPAMTATSGPG